jgi:hypothetical protein
MGKIFRENSPSFNFNRSVSHGNFSFSPLVIHSVLILHFNKSHFPPHSNICDSFLNFVAGESSRSLCEAQFFFPFHFLIFFSVHLSLTPIFLLHNFLNFQQFSSLLHTLKLHFRTNSANFTRKVGKK